MLRIYRPAAAIDAVRHAKAEGLAVTADTAPALFPVKRTGCQHL